VHLSAEIEHERQNALSVLVNTVHVHDYISPAEKSGDDINAPVKTLSMPLSVFYDAPVPLPDFTIFTPEVKRISKLCSPK
jgi:hypothetical protein